MDAFTLTFGDCMENHVGMQKVGSIADKGFSKKDLISIQNKFEESESDQTQRLLSQRRF